MKIVQGMLQGPEHDTVLKGALEQVPSPPRGSCDAHFYTRYWNLQKSQGLTINKIAFELKSLWSWVIFPVLFTESTCRAGGPHSSVRHFLTGAPSSDGLEPCQHPTFLWVQGRILWEPGLRTIDSFSKISGQGLWRAGQCLLSSIKWDDGVTEDGSHQFGYNMLQGP